MKVKGQSFYVESGGYEWVTYASFSSIVRLQKHRETWTAWLTDCCVEVRCNGPTPEDAWDALRTEVVRRQEKVLQRMEADNAG